MIYKQPRLIWLNQTLFILRQVKRCSKIEVKVGEREIEEERKEERMEREMEGEREKGREA